MPSSFHDSGHPRKATACPVPPRQIPIRPPIGALHPEERQFFSTRSSCAEPPPAAMPETATPARSNRPNLRRIPQKIQNSRQTARGEHRWGGFDCYHPSPHSARGCTPANLLCWSAAPLTNPAPTLTGRWVRPGARGAMAISGPGRTIRFRLPAGADGRSTKPQSPIRTAVVANGPRGDGWTFLGDAAYCETASSGIKR